LSSPFPTEQFSSSQRIEDFHQSTTPTSGYHPIWERRSKTFLQRKFNEPITSHLRDQLNELFDSMSPDQKENERLKLLQMTAMNVMKNDIEDTEQLQLCILDEFLHSTSLRLSRHFNPLCEHLITVQEILREIRNKHRENNDDQESPVIYADTNRLLGNSLYELLSRSQALILILPTMNIEHAQLILSMKKEWESFKTKELKLTSTDSKWKEKSGNKKRERKCGSSELKTLELLELGWSLKEISIERKLKYTTIKTHVYRLLKEGICPIQNLILESKLDEMQILFDSIPHLERQQQREELLKICDHNSVDLFLLTLPIRIGNTSSTLLS